MSLRIDTSCVVVSSYADPEGIRCVDLFARSDGTYGFEEFRRDPEDLEAWTPVSYYANAVYPNPEQALAAARLCIPWLVATAGMSS